jgi:hypothetical protein
MAYFELLGSIKSMMNFLALQIIEQTERIWKLSIKCVKVKVKVWKYYGRSVYFKKEPKDLNKK